MKERWWREGDSDFWRGYGVDGESAKSIRSLREGWREVFIIDEVASVYQTPGGLYLVAEDEYGLIRLVYLEKIDDYLIYKR